MIKKLVHTAGLQLAAFPSRKSRIAAMIGAAAWLTAAPVPVSAQLLSTNTNWVDSGQQFSFGGTTYALGTYTFQLSWDTAAPNTWSAIVRSQPWYGSEASAWSAAYAWTSQTIARNLPLLSSPPTYEEGWSVASQVTLDGALQYGFVGIFDWQFIQDSFEVDEGDRVVEIQYETFNLVTSTPFVCREEPSPYYTLNAAAYFSDYDCTRHEEKWERGIDDGYEYDDAPSPKTFRFVGVQALPDAPTVVPEPESAALVGLGLIGLAIARRRRAARSPRP
ncbi:MAG: PEP-CTERM sorting domain-containing protein [Gemmatimonadota bacterium]|nr:PEP-CTERM sorting domain-containing protein [Gemmatimonadota bacterium]